MALVLELRRRGRHVMGSTVGALVVAYFLFHAVQGDRGMLAWLQLRQQITVVETVLEQSRISRQHWQSRIALLQSRNLDRDLLGERARLVTGLVNEAEFVVLGENVSTLP